MNKKRSMLMAIAVFALAAALVALAACSQPASSSKSEEKPEANEASEPAVQVDKNPFYVLVIGNDTRKGTEGIKEKAYADGKARSDTMMLVRVDAANHKLTLVTIPRDTQDSRADGTYCKINERYHTGGASELMQAVESLTGVKPRYYLDTTFVGFQDIVNKLGGITMNVPFDQEMTDVVTGERLQYSAGEQKLNGAQALIYARQRHAYEDMGYDNQEAYRQSADRKILETIIKTILANPSNAVSLTEAVYPYLDTNWPLDEVKAYVKDFAEAGNVTFLSGTGPFDGDIEPSTSLWMATRDEALWRQIMATVDAGGDPNTVLQAPSIAG